MINLSGSFLSVSEAAEHIGITEGRVRQMLRSGEMHGAKVGTVWLVPPKEAERIRKTPQSVGRPRTRKDE